MENDQREGFFGCVGKVNGIDIVLKHKPGKVYNKKIFYIRKKRYALNFYVIYNSNKRFIYIFANWPHSLHNI